MENLVKMKDGKVMATSKMVADKFGKIHRNVMRDIANLECSDEFRLFNFEQTSYKSSQNKVLPCYEMTKDGFSFLCMGFTGSKAAVWKEKYIIAFNEMYEMLSAGSGTSVMKSLNEALRLMEDDKKVASVCGKGLAQWKATRVEHIDRVTSLHKEAQMLLGFTS